MHMQSAKRTTLSGSQKAGIAVIAAALLLPAIWFAAAQLFSLQAAIGEVTLPGVQNIHMSVGETICRTVQTDTENVDADKLEIVLSDTRVADAAFLQKSTASAPLQIEITALRPGSTSIYIRVKNSDVRSADCTVAVQENLTDLSQDDTTAFPGSDARPQLTAAAPEQTASFQTSAVRTYVLNTNSKKFHNPDCTGILHMKASNRQEITDTRENLIAQGYSPCGICNP